MNDKTEPVEEGATESAQAREPRSRVLKGARAAFNHEFSAIPCIVRDMSDTGAKVKFDEGWFVPERFTLFIDVDGIKVDCERVWFRGRDCGVRFVGPLTQTRHSREQVLNPYKPGAESAENNGAAQTQDASANRRVRPHASAHFGRRER